MLKIDKRTKTVAQNAAPHFSTVLILFLAALFTMALQEPKLLNTQVRKLSYRLAWDTGNGQLKASLARHYLEHGYTLQAQLLTAPLQPTTLPAKPAPIVLGMQDQTSVSLLTLNQADLLQKQLYWQQVVRDYPQYRDGWIQLYYLSSGETVAQSYLHQVNQLDPLAASTLPHW